VRMMHDTSGDVVVGAQEVFCDALPKMTHNHKHWCANVMAQK